MLQANKILNSTNIFSKEVIDGASQHHEHYDGSGYPNGLSEELLSDFAMIVAIADVYDAMTSNRSYRKGICPFKVMVKAEDSAVTSKCTACGICAKACPMDVLEVVES